MDKEGNDIPAEEAAQETVVEQNNEENTATKEDQAPETIEEPSSEEIDNIIVDGEPLIVAETENKEPAPQWAKDLRKIVREKEKQIKELNKKLLENISRPEPEVVTLGEKPALADYDYDEEAHAKALEEYVLRKAQVDAQKRQKELDLQERQRQSAAEINNKLSEYAAQKAKLRIDDFEAAEENVAAHLDETQQAIILKGSKNPALLVYALGANQEKAKVKELAKITDPVEFAFEVARLETKIQITKKSPPPPVEDKVKTSGVATDKTLEKLREKAYASGDFTELNRYKTSLRNQR